ncbi:MAG: hypothetical protein EZS28_004458 [Streblomastix strix]|uniref:Uncharacterized protein n=1 Tax=Streblomastix strix TaxID=222440 RepID=A0A5J4WY89_9EUKA|nr:MAG: hypothetical protein EZS28_004458 [Streblomastix strix]
MEPSMEPQIEPPTEPQIEPQIEPQMEPLMEAPIGRPATPRQGRPRKCYTEEEANDMARLQRKQFKQQIMEGKMEMIDESV